nr:uncharacterized protein LOC112211709 [Halyomorpha halys]
MIASKPARGVFLSPTRWRGVAPTKLPRRRSKRTPVSSPAPLESVRPASTQLHLPPEELQAKPCHSRVRSQRFFLSCVNAIKYSIKWHTMETGDFRVIVLL